MTTSLKAFIPKLAKTLGMNPTALYERQRALIRGGLLKTKAGHGPGSGVRLSPESVAMLLISVMATDSLVQVEERTEVFARLKSIKGVCPLTGKKTFASALAAVFASENLSKRVANVFVERSSDEGHLFYEAQGTSVLSMFSAQRKRLGPIFVNAQIFGDVIRQIVAILGEADAG